MPFDDLLGKSVNAFDFFVRPRGVSTVTPTESECSDKVILTLLTAGSWKKSTIKNHPSVGMVSGRCNPHHPANFFTINGVDV